MNEWQRRDIVAVLDRSTVSYEVRVRILCADGTVWDVSHTLMSSYNNVRVRRVKVEEVGL
jgi:hypothetical protein